MSNKKLNFISAMAVAVMILFSNFSSAQKTTAKSSTSTAKSGSSVSKSANSKPSVSKPSAPRTSVSNSKSPASSTHSSGNQNSNRQVVPTPQPSKPGVVANPNNLEAKPDRDLHGSGEVGQKVPSSPDDDGNNTNDESTSSGEEQTSNNIQPYRQDNCRKEYRRDWNQRHCGCSGEITFVNLTDDTLNIYLRWVNNERLPVIDGSAQESLEIRSLVPDFRLLPGDETSILNNCKGGVLYEAVAKGRRKDNTDRWRGSVRFTCTGSLVVFEEINRE